MGIKDFAPSWFASVMGTRALALASKFYSLRLAFLENLATALTYLNTALFIFLLISWFLRWLKYRENAVNDLYHLILGNF